MECVSIAVLLPKMHRKVPSWMLQVRAASDNSPVHAMAGHAEGWVAGARQHIGVWHKGDRPAAQDIAGHRIICARIVHSRGIPTAGAGVNPANRRTAMP